MRDFVSCILSTTGLGGVQDCEGSVVVVIVHRTEESRRLSHAGGYFSRLTNPPILHWAQRNRPSAIPARFDASLASQCHFETSQTLGNLVTKAEVTTCYPILTPAVGAYPRPFQPRHFGPHLQRAPHLARSEAQTHSKICRFPRFLGCGRSGGCGLQTPAGAFTCFAKLILDPPPLLTFLSSHPVTDVGANGIASGHWSYSGVIDSEAKNTRMTREKYRCDSDLLSNLLLPPPASTSA